MNQELKNKKYYSEEYLPLLNETKARIRSIFKYGSDGCPNCPDCECPIIYGEEKVILEKLYFNLYNALRELEKIDESRIKE